MTRKHRPPSSRFPTLVADGRLLWLTSTGDAVPCEAPSEIAAAARRLCEVECVVWVHEQALDAWRWDDDAGWRAGREIGGGGWWLIPSHPPTVHVAVPAMLGEMSGTSDPHQLGLAVETWRETVGMAFMFSAASTVHKLIGSLAKLPTPDAPPVMEVPYAATAWSVPSNTWAPDGVLDLCAAAGRRWVRAFDRAGSYLSAWRGAALPAGGWTDVGRCRALPGGETQKPAGYWLVHPRDLPDTGGLFDPWRRHGDADGHRWLTTPLVQLAADLAGEPIEALCGLWAAEKCRALDAPAERLASARVVLTGRDTEAAGVALAALKEGYAGATSWFQYGPKPPDPLARASWRHTILDRYAANTYRGLAGATPGPFAFGEIDAALFALDEPDEIPTGLREAPSLGGWKPKGQPVPIDAALDAYHAGGARALLALIEKVPA